MVIYCIARDVLSASIPSRVIDSLLSLMAANLGLRVSVLFLREFKKIAAKTERRKRKIFAIITKNTNRSFTHAIASIIFVKQNGIAGNNKTNS